MKIDVGRGWYPLVLDAVLKISQLPDAWNARLRRADRMHGLLRVDVAVNLPDSSEELGDQTSTIGAIQRIARVVSMMTCEACGRDGRLRIGVRRSRMLCEDHACLVGERHPMDGLVSEIDRDRHPELYFRAEDADVEKAEIFRMWSEGIVPMRVVTDFLRIGRTDVYHAALEAGHGTGLREADPEEVRIVIEMLDPSRRH
ncbi:hypothetical protein [Gellertiella hungarica]|uniref:Uncharacterized protein n=1 Tax=Gellertiella hungarica TaxID=1572859 RepID=A0A7W6NK81_9HYPH|nr:hypothetical protein [Gellertiella hungarica]MBB4064012.1 hypothetical protein [Gellertiella hungarica]